MGTNEEGKKFTLRLSEHEVKILQEIKSESGIKTDSGAIKFVLSNYLPLNSRYMDARNKNVSLTQELKDKEKKIEAFLSAFDGLKK